MLKTRAITYVVLVTLVVSGILYLPSFLFTLISGLIFLVAVWEWTRLAGFQSVRGRVGCFILIPFIALLILALLLWIGKGILFEVVPFIVVAFWVFALIVIYRYPKDSAFLSSQTVGVIAGCLTLAPPWVALNALHHVHPYWVLYVMILVWVADTAAYFAGRSFGKHKLALAVSPGKTWEGAMGALVMTLLISIGAYRLFELTYISLWEWMLLNAVTVGFSIVGDLFESLFKRLRNLKDSGVILPGHGGILDRIDSLTAALPIFTLGFVLLSLQ